MNPWVPGASEIDHLIAQREIDRLRNAHTGVAGLMARARQQLSSAGALLESDPVTAYVIAYDAAKHSGITLLAAQDLRPTRTGGHLAVEKALVRSVQGCL